MSIVLPPEWEAFVNIRVASGAYASEQDVLRTTFDLLQRRDDLLTHIDEGTRQLRAGQYREYRENDREVFLADVAASKKPRLKAGN
jgi:Arc/MetJ-type ribon-helix-helix transcriptional regulator